jgi:CheY-like chemotaxis protein
VILMDVQLPGMSGLELTRLLKADPLRSKIPVIAITANNSSAGAQAIMEAGADGFISKPIDHAHFATRICAFLRETAPPVPVTGGISLDEQIAQLKRAFLLEGVEESKILLGALEGGAVDSTGMDLRKIGKILHRWIGCGGSAGIPEISDRAGKMRELAACNPPDITALTEEAQALGKLFDDALAERL